MIPMKTSSIFKSRWMALIWAAGIIWFAYDFAGSAPPEEANENVSRATGAPVTDQDSNKVTEILSN